MDEQELARACADRMWSDDNASRQLGMTIDRIAPGEAVMSMTVSPTMVNGVGTCHGGFIFTLADSTFAFACNTYNRRTVAQAASISFLAPAFADDRLTAIAREIARKGRGGLYDVTVRNQAGETVAEFRGQSRTTKGSPLPAVSIGEPVRESGDE